MTRRSWASEAWKISTRRAEFAGRLFDGAKLDAAAAVEDEVEQLEGVSAFLVALDAHPMGEAFQVERLEVGGHGQVELGGVELFCDLAIEGILHLGTEHRSTP